MSVNYREPQWLLPNEKNLQYPAADATQGSGLTADRHSLYSMYFNVDHRIDLGSSINLGVNSTISFWYKTSTNNNGSVVFGESTYSYEYLLQWGSSANKIYFRIGSVVTDFTGITEIEDGNWHHYCIIRTGANAELFVDGASRGTVTGLPTGTNTLIDTIGATPSGTHTIDNSYLDEIAFWSRSLSSDEVTTLYNSGSPSNPMLLSGKPVAYYPLGEQARKPGTSEWRFPNEVLQSQTIDFDGTDYINLDKSLTNLNVSTSFSISCWVNISTNTNYYHIVGAPTSYAAWDTGFGLYTNGSGIRFWVEQWNGANQYVETASLTNNQWYHILATFNTTNGLKLYVNGGTPTTATGTTIDGLSNEIFIGSTGTNTTYGFNGKLSNIAIWNSDESANIANIYNYGTPQTSYTVTPTAWYKLDKTSEYAGLNPNWHNALSFDGSSDYIDVGNVLNFERTDAFSISAWCYFDGTGTMSIFSKLENTAPFRGYSLFQSSTSVLNFYLTNDNSPSNRIAVYANLPSPTTSAWKHVVVTYNGSSNASGVNFYVNGSILSKTISIDTLSATIITSTNANIGARASVSEFFNGQISNLAIFDQVISAEDVKYLYNGGTPQTNISFEPVSWWKLDNLTTGIQDSGSASNNGTNNGATAVSSSVAVDQWNFDNAVQSQTPNWSSALSFDGSSSYITVPKNITTDFSVSFWIKPDTGVGANYDGILGQGTTSAQGGILRYVAYDGSGTSGSVFVFIGSFTNVSGTVTNGAWTNIVLTYDSTADELKGYNNGSLYTTISNPNFSGQTTDSHSFERIGMRNGTTGTIFNGLISNVQQWDTALPATGTDSVETLYNNGTPLTTAISSSPVSWYKLDNTTTGIQDSIGSNNGTIVGTVPEIQTNVWTPRLNGESDTLPSTALVNSDLQFNSAYSSFSLNFDQGSSDYVNCGEVAELQNASVITWNCWVNFATANFNIVFGKQLVATNDVIQFYTWASGVGYFFLKTAGTAVTASINPFIASLVNLNEWNMFTITFDGAQTGNDRLKIYLNGGSTNIITSYSATPPATLPNTTDDFYIGRGTNGYFDGKIDEFSIFNKSLNQAERTSIYNNGYPKDITALSPVSWWRLGEDAYFNGNDFIVPNQITGAPNGTSDNMTATDLVADAPGSYAAGLGSSLALADRVGDAALSTANSLSFNMTPVNRVSYPAGYVPTQADNVYSMAFDGATTKITFPTITLATNYTLSAWAKRSSTANMFLFGNSQTYGYGAYFNGTSNLYFKEDNSSLMTFNNAAIQTALARTDWVHWAFVKDATAGTVSIYVDGVLAQSVSGSGMANINAIGGSGLSIGTQYIWNGNIDEVAIFDYALSARQIKQDIYNGTTTGKTADLNNISNLTAPVAWYRMGD